METLTPAKAILLGLVQGLTEFLPVSSSAHLAITQQWLKAPVPLTFDILLHLATLLAVLMVIDKRVVAIVKNIKNCASTIKIIAVATMVTAIFGLLVENKISLFFNKLHFVGIFLVVNALILASTHPKLPKIKLKKPSGLWLGLAQSLALLPGISRSGTTITTAKTIGFKPQEAFEISFLLYIPAVLGAVALEIAKTPLNINQTNITPATLGFLVAFISGWGALKLLQNVLQKSKLWIFAPYCIVLGLLLLFF